MCVFRAHVGSGLADDPSFRWLGVRTKARSSGARFTLTLFDLWATMSWRCHCGNCCLISSRRSWCLRDLSYLEEVLSEQGRLELLRDKLQARPNREPIATWLSAVRKSVGWRLRRDQVRELTARAIDQGF